MPGRPGAIVARLRPWRGGAEVGAQFVPRGVSWAPLICRWLADNVGFGLGPAYSPVRPPRLGVRAAQIPGDRSSAGRGALDSNPAQQPLRKGAPDAPSAIAIRLRCIVHAPSRLPFPVGRLGHPTRRHSPDSQHAQLNRCVMHRSVAPARRLAARSSPSRHVHRDVQADRADIDRTVGVRGSNAMRTSLPPNPKRPARI
jgi:hypothetical protein